MPLTKNGKEVLSKMTREYGSGKKGKQVFYASINKGVLKGMEGNKASSVKKEAKKEKESFKHELKEKMTTKKRK